MNARTGLHVVIGALLGGLAGNAGVNGEWVVMALLLLTFVLNLAVMTMWQLRD